MHAESSSYPLRYVAHALESRSHLGVLNINKALGAGDFHSLMEISQICEFAGLLANDLNSSYQQCAPVARPASVLRNVEAQLLLTHAQVISDLKRKLMIQSMHAVAVSICIRGSL